MVKFIKGGSDLQFELLQKYVDINNAALHRIPNPNSKSLYHIDGPINQHKKNIIWTHQSYDMIESFSVQHHYDSVDKIVFVSNWQERKYIETFKIPSCKNVVIENGIEPIPEHAKPSTKTIHLVYTSTPYRGLDVLLQAFQYIQNLDVHLHVFSSMKIYGQESEDKKYEHLYDFCKKHPKITYYGSVSHDTIKDALQEMHVLAYPSTFEETSCISVIESMSAQCAVVCPNLGALPETTNRFANIYCYNEDKLKHAELFAKHLQYSIENYKQKNYKLQKEFFDSRYSWKDTIKYKWQNLINSIEKMNTSNINYV
jgi:glycosyltransferase involved in cell wall biosynthesis